MLRLGHVGLFRRTHWVARLARATSVAVDVVVSGVVEQLDQRCLQGARGCRLLGRNLVDDDVHLRAHTPHLVQPRLRLQPHLFQLLRGLGVAHIAYSAVAGAEVA